MARIVAGCWKWDGADDARKDSRCQVMIVRATAFKEHPSYTTNEGIDDSIVLLSYPFEMTEYVRTICLPPAGEYYQGMGTVAGYGWHSGSIAAKPHSTMMFVHINLLPSTDCSVPYSHGSEKYILDPVEEICAGFKSNSRGTCYADSGAPLMVKIGYHSFVIGILRGGAEVCNTPGFPAIFVRVTSILQWIDGIIH